MLSPMNRAALLSNSISILRPHRSKNEKREKITYRRFKNIIKEAYQIKKLTPNFYAFRIFGNTHMSYVKFK